MLWSTVASKLIVAIFTLYILSMPPSISMIVSSIVPATFPVWVIDPLPLQSVNVISLPLVISINLRPLSTLILCPFKQITDPVAKSRLLSTTMSFSSAKYLRSLLFIMLFTSFTSVNVYKSLCILPSRCAYTSAVLLPHIVCVCWSKTTSAGFVSFTVYVFLLNSHGVSTSSSASDGAIHTCSLIGLSWSST